MMETLFALSTNNHHYIVTRIFILVRKHTQTKEENHSAAALAPTFYAIYGFIDCRCRAHNYVFVFHRFPFIQ